MPAWGDEEKKQWLSQQVIKRSYEADVLPTIEACRDRFDVEQYGTLDYADKIYPLFAIKSRNFDSSKKSVLVTGGVHGYETSGNSFVYYCLLFVMNYVRYQRGSCVCKYSCIGVYTAL